MNTQDLKDQLAPDLGDTTAKLTVRDLIVRGEIETPRASVRKPRPVPTFERALVDGAATALSYCDALRCGISSTISLRRSRRALSRRRRSSSLVSSFRRALSARSSSPAPSAGT
jgi:hypothetical protein